VAALAFSTQCAIAVSTAASERDMAQADEANGEGSAASHDDSAANHTEARYGKVESPT
jgi:hypothetical protein